MDYVDDVTVNKNESMRPVSRTSIKLITSILFQTQRDYVRHYHLSAYNYPPTCEGQRGWGEARGGGVNKGPACQYALFI